MSKENASMFRAALSKVVHGLLVGAGFAVALGLMIFSYGAWQERKFREHGQEIREEADDPGLGFKHYTPRAGLAIKEHRPQRLEANSAFVGSIQNSGKDAWQSVGLLVELFDKDGVFLDKCSGHLDGLIGPGQTRNFKVSCSECRDPSRPLAYDRYTIAISDAYFVEPEAKLKH
jgi:hypothetical protein